MKDEQKKYVKKFLVTLSINLIVALIVMYITGVIGQGVSDGKVVGVYCYRHPKDVCYVAAKDKGEEVFHYRVPPEDADDIERGDPWPPKK